MKKNKIVIDPEIMLGKPVIRGTRVTVEQILRLLAQGQTQEEIRQNFPYLTKEDIRAAVEYAHAVIAEEEVYRFDEKEFTKIRQVHRG